VGGLGGVAGGGGCAECEFAAECSSSVISKTPPLRNLRPPSPPRPTLTTPPPPSQHSTHHLLSTPQFLQMKPSSIIINTARGAVIDEAALVAALEAGEIASVGLDVYEEEPKIHRGLVGNPRVMLLPHMGTWTVEVSLGWGFVFFWRGWGGMGAGRWGRWRRWGKCKADNSPCAIDTNRHGTV